MSIRNSIATAYHAIQLARKYPSSQRLKVMRDYIALYRAKGLTLEEYYEFEFDKRSEAFRQNFLGLNEQRLYLDLLNPLNTFRWPAISSWHIKYWKTQEYALRNFTVITNLKRLMLKVPSVQVTFPQYYAF